jgi:hypothetical protein
MQSQFATEHNAFIAANRIAGWAANLEAILTAVSASDRCTHVQADQPTVFSPNLFSFCDPFSQAVWNANSGSF